MTATQPNESRVETRDFASCPVAPGRVQFTLRCPGAQAYLLLAREDKERTFLAQMTRDAGAWRLTLDLRPGRYRYRYYVSEGRSTAYFSPADTDPVGRVTVMDGMDAVFEVAPGSPIPAHQIDRAGRPPSGRASAWATASCPAVWASC